MNRTKDQTIAELQQERAELQRALDAALARLDAERGVVDRLLSAISARSTERSVESKPDVMPPEQVGPLVMGFASMTLKQRAVTLATLDGASYRDIAAAMGVDETTVKLHLKAALNKLGAINRAALVQYKDQIVKALEAAGGEATFGAPVGWITSRPAALMDAIAPRTGRPAPPGRKKEEHKPLTEEAS